MSPISDEHGYAAHAAEESFDLAKAIAEDLFGVIFSAELDFFTKFLSVMVMFSFTFEIIYILLPRALRVKIDNLDFDTKSPSISIAGKSFSVTGLVAFLSLISLLSFKL